MWLLDFCEQASVNLIGIMVEKGEYSWLHLFCEGKRCLNSPQASALSNAYRALSVGNKREIWIFYNP